MASCLVWLAFLIQSQLAQACPDQCLCLSQIQVLCNTGNLKEIPRNFPPETQEITITHQDIREIPPNIFANLKHLKKLMLDSNNITTIRPFAFKGLKDVTHISVQDNPIQRLEGFAFAGVRNVSNLLLGHNQISLIEGYAFAGTELIQMLLLNNNPIKTVASSAFSGLKHVKFLFLPAGVRNLEADAFNGLEMVDKVKLAYLDLSELLPYTFRGIKKLRTLTIENSDLATIRSNAFTGMTDVEELRIVKNKIDRLEDFSLPSQNTVKNLILEGNHILAVPSLSALEDIRVESITVVNNHFPCNCRVVYLMESVMGTSSPHFLDNNKCISPLSLNGLPMSRMKQTGFLQKCDRKKVIEEARKEDEIRRRYQSNSRSEGEEVFTKSSSKSDHFSPFSIIVSENSSLTTKPTFSLIIVLATIIIPSGLLIRATAAF